MSSFLLQSMNQANNQRFGENQKEKKKRENMANRMFVFGRSAFVAYSTAV